MRSIALKCTQMRSIALNCAQLHSKALNCTQSRSNALTCTHMHSLPFIQEIRYDRYVPKKAPKSCTRVVHRYGIVLYCTSLNVVLLRLTFFTCTHHAKNITSPRQHSPTMTVSAGPSEIHSPHKNHRRYKTSDATRFKYTTKATISPARLPWFVVFSEIASHNHHAIFVTFFDMDRRDRNLAFSLLVSCFDVIINYLCFYIAASTTMLSPSPSGFSKLSCVSRT